MQIARPCRASSVQHDTVPVIDQHRAGEQAQTVRRTSDEDRRIVASAGVDHNDSKTDNFAYWRPHA